jgi:hypothetical protein
MSHHEHRKRRKPKPVNKQRPVGPQAADPYRPFRQLERHLGAARREKVLNAGAGC